MCTYESVLLDLLIYEKVHYCSLVRSHWLSDCAYCQKYMNNHPIKQSHNRWITQESRRQPECVSLPRNDSTKIMGYFLRQSKPSNSTLSVEHPPRRLNCFSEVFSLHTEGTEKFNFREVPQSSVYGAIKFHFAPKSSSLGKAWNFIS